MWTRSLRGTDTQAAVTLELCWHRRTISIAQFTGERVVKVGRHPLCDFVVPVANAPVWVRLPLVRLSRGEVWLHTNPGFKGVLVSGSARRNLDTFAAAGAGAIALTPGETAILEFDELSLHVARTKPEEAARPVPAFDSRELAALVMILALAALMFLVTALYSPRRLVTGEPERLRRAIWKVDLYPQAVPAAEPSTAPASPAVPPSATSARHAVRPTAPDPARPRNQHSIFNVFRRLRGRSELDAALSGSAQLLGQARAAPGEVESAGPATTALRTLESGGATTVTGVQVLGKTGGGMAGGFSGGLGVKGVAVVVASSAAVVVEGRIDREGIRRVILANQREIKACYDRGLGAGVDIHGKVVLSWDIDERGTPRNARIRESSLVHAGVERCLTSLVGQWRFPPAPAGQIAEVSFPFIFLSDSR